LYYRSGPTKYFSRGIAMGRNVVAKINEKLDKKKEKKTK
jgi:hypothetical protein